MAPPAYVRTTLWVCCRCGDTANAATTVQCVSCHHGFAAGHCTQETHDSSASH